MASGCYVYAILGSDTRLPSGLAGLSGATLSTIACRDLAAAVSCADPTGLRPTSEHVLRHEAIVEALRLSGPLLPVRFGSILPDPGAVAQAIAERYAVLVADLTRLGDKIELGLTVLWGDEGTGCDGIQPVREGSLDLITQGATGPGTQYLRARLKEYRQEQLLQSRAKTLAQGVDDVLRNYSLESHITLLPAPRVALRGTYLLEPSKFEAFREAFEEIRQQNPRLRFLLSGPWPPYSFVTPPDASPTPPDGLGDLLLAPVSG